ncbi:uncharacterized protein N7446_008787 [Penicillium canescens]|uniref:Alcohol dehydrogenase-like N-terminal domain-containing protein n=1 Tax=Penicillium canescens TaxID=5083 RepID=A0AAD6INY1_PENCN|nr:uncharacterized protein N7446_008787 [Penicillium canescens]KAJ6057890.1 hypothetical protein N7460_001164 [Penicillium canescens]KAJ6059204.1 hypothetical protein N7446_008787 [Penicillium canescens]
MKEVINLAGPSVKLVDSAIPRLNDDQVLIKVVVSGSNPKDWKVPDVAASGKSNLEMMLKAKKELNQGDDIAGVVEKVGSNLVEFKAIALQPFTKCAHLVALMLKATITLAAFTAAISLYTHLRFPPPWTPAAEPIPFIVYGAITAVGSFAIKLACNSNIHPIIAIAGKDSHYVGGLLDPSQGDIVIDYREGIETTVKKIKGGIGLAGHSNVLHALDAVIIPQSAEVLKQSVAPSGQIDFTLPNDLDVSPAIKSITSVGSVHKQHEFENNEELGFIFSRYFTRALSNCTFSGHPFEVRSRPRC